MLAKSKEDIKQVAQALVSQRLWWLMLISVPVLGLPGCSLGVLSAMSVFVSHGWFETLLSLIGAVIGLGTPVLIPFILNWIHRIPAASFIEKGMAMEKSAVQQCFDLLKKPSYFNATLGISGGAIAVDASNSQIAVVFGKMQANSAPITRAVVFNTSDLRSWSAVEAGVTNFYPVGGGHTSTDLMRIHQDNLNESIKQAQKTGLTLITDKLEATEILLNFDVKTAKSWSVLLEKMCRGKLEDSSSPTVYPFAQISA